MLVVRYLSVRVFKHQHKDSFLSLLSLLAISFLSLRSLLLSLLETVLLQSAAHQWSGRRWTVHQSGNCIHTLCISKLCLVSGSEQTLEAGAGVFKTWPEPSKWQNGRQGEGGGMGGGLFPSCNHWTANYLPRSAVHCDALSCVLCCILCTMHPAQQASKHRLALLQTAL